MARPIETEEDAAFEADPISPLTVSPVNHAMDMWNNAASLLVVQEEGSSAMDTCEIVRLASHAGSPRRS